MRIDHASVGTSARTLSHAGALIERAVHAVHPSGSALGRLGAVLAAARLGARLLPQAKRLLRRYPVAGTLAIAGVLGVMVLARFERRSTRD
jgi:hypothetical protein